MQQEKNAQTIRLRQVLPDQIEQESMRIIVRELKQQNITLDESVAPIVKRVIHTSADFEYAHTLHFSANAVERGIKALQQGATIVTDTNMAKAGINHKALAKLGCQVVCFMADEEVAAAAKAAGTTRAVASMEKAAKLSGPVVFAIGNAPTALVRLCQLAVQQAVSPELIIGVPVGFVNVVESKQLLASLPVPHIVAMGRKGGSNVAAAICNALLYQAGGR